MYLFTQEKAEFHSYDSNRQSENFKVNMPIFADVYI